MTTENLHALAQRFEAMGATYIAALLRRLLTSEVEQRDLEDKLTKMGMSDLIKENYGN